MRTKQYKAVFTAKIDFKYEEHDQKTLQSGGIYYLNNDSESKVSYNNISNEAVRIINDDLKMELQKYTSISIKEVEVQAVYEGSIEIIYSVVLGFLDLIGGLKDLYDVCQLIRRISDKHINKRLSDRFGKHFRVDTDMLVPGIRNWRYKETPVDFQSAGNGVGKRDVFFYYLIVANIVLLLIVGVLVFRAVKQVYF